MRLFTLILLLIATSDDFARAESPSPDDAEKPVATDDATTGQAEPEKVQAKTQPKVSPAPKAPKGAALEKPAPPSEKPGQPGALAVKTDSEVQIGVADVNGQLVKEIDLQKDAKGFYDLLFRAKFSEKHADYVSWAFEASDPQENRYYQMAFEGKIPEIIHWDGLFSDETEVKLNKQYHFRLLLVKPDGKLVGSPWNTFTGIVKRPYEGPKNRGEYITLYVMPYGGGHFLVVKTKTQSATIFPNLVGDFRVNLFDEYMCGMGFDTTANTLFGYTASPDSFGFSEISGYCRYRLLGSPLRAPVLPLTPSYMGKDFKPHIPEDAWGKPTSVEVGVKLFYSTLRGMPGAALDSELFRAATGLSATAHASQAFWVFRAHGGLELGYSVFRGSLLTFSGELGVTFDRLRDLAPGLQFRYSYFGGNPPGDQVNAATAVANHLLFFGVMGYFKL